MTSEFTYPLLPCQVHDANGKPSCTEWLFASSDSQPDHVCQSYMQWSTYEFVTARMCGYRGEDAYHYVFTWPVPVGYKALEDWHSSRRWIHNTPEEELGAVLTELLRDGQFTGVPDLVLTPPICPNDHRAWLAFAVGRLPNGAPLYSKNEEAWVLREYSPSPGRLWFLGLVRKLSDTLVGSPEWPPDRRGRITVEYDSGEITSGETAATYSERVKVTAEGASVLYATTWRYIEPAVLIEAYPSKPRELAALVTMADELLEWYNETLLGKEFRVRTVGRPVGSTAIPDSEFPAHYEAAYRRLWRDKDRRPSDDDIYREMGISRATFYAQVARLKRQGISLPCPSEPVPPDPKP